MVLETDSAVSQPAAVHQLDKTRLLGYLRQHAEDFPRDAKIIDVHKFSHGQSNPTYLLQAGNRKYVLRKKPPGQVLASAHAVEREYKVLAALRDTPVPVPRALCLCEDSSIIGTPFYLIDHVKGRIFEDPALPELPPGERGAAYRQLARTLAALHSVKPEQVGLKGYGRMTGYCARQVWRWSQQYYSQLKAEPLPEMADLIQWLKEHIPEDDNYASVTRVSHGDFRLDNLVMHPTSADRVLAVLDWELSTLGYPLADLAYSAMCYHLPVGFPGMRGLPQPLPAGIPTEPEYVSTYCKARGIPAPDPTKYAFCMALSLFRAAAIMAGIGARVQLGNASSAQAAQVGSQQVVITLARQALAAIHDASGASSKPCATPSMGNTNLGMQQSLSASATSAGGRLDNGHPQQKNDSSKLATQHAVPSMNSANTAIQYGAARDEPDVAGRSSAREPQRTGSSQQGQSDDIGSSNASSRAATQHAVPAMSSANTAMLYGTARHEPDVAGKTSTTSEMSLRGRSSWHGQVPAGGSSSPASNQHACQACASGQCQCKNSGNCKCGQSGQACPSCSQQCKQQHGVATPAAVGFDCPPLVQELVQQVRQFMDRHILPSEHVLEAHSAEPSTKWTIHPLMEELKGKAKAQGLWNLWLPRDMAERIAHLRELVPESERTLLTGRNLTNLEYAFLSEQMGRSVHASEVFNCSAPDTGNMEVLSRYGTQEQQRQWLLPLLQGRIRSCFAMTEPEVASSDATNIQSQIVRQGNDYVITGRKWWASGAPDPRCKIAIFMGKTDLTAPTHKQQSMILVPMDVQGVQIIRPLPVFGYDDAPHGHAEVMFKGVRVPASNMLLGEGRGFEIAQGRLGPGRLHHCMRLIGMGERALELMAKRGMDRVAFKKRIAEHGAFRADLARARIELSAARLTVLAAAHALDKLGNKKQARGQIAAAKVYAPSAVLRVIDAAIQVHGGAGVSDDFPLARLWAGARTLRLADGPDDVHLVSIAKLELARVSKL